MFNPTKLGSVIFRFTHASLDYYVALSQRLSLKQWGSSVAFTMDVYSHIIGGMQNDAMLLPDEALPNGENQKLEKEALS